VRKSKGQTGESGGLGVLRSNEAMNGSFLGQMDTVVFSTLIVLVVMSAASWYYGLTKAWHLWQVRTHMDGIIDAFWGAASLPQAIAQLDKHPDDPFARLARQCAKAAEHYQKHAPNRLGEATSLSDFLTRSLRHTINHETARLESGLTLLATVGSTAPFIGLFGTVWGIYHALSAIGAKGEASLETVAGPVGEALIMTALGLAVAIPAVLAYNAIVRSNRLILTDLDAFAHDLHAYFTTGARVLEGGGRDLLQVAATRASMGVKP
jgi:biopolymer transport protein ExbB